MMQDSLNTIWESAPLRPTRAFQEHHATSAAGRAWLERLPALAAEYAQRWELTFTRNMNSRPDYWCLAGLDRQGREIVLRLPRSRRQGNRQAWALGCWPTVAPRVYALDARRGVSLMERMRPGTQPEPQLRLARQAGAIIRQLSTSATPAELHDRFPRLSERLVERFPQTAPGLLVDLQALERPSQLVHGDLRHSRLQLSEEGALLSDPDPMLGPSGWDAAWWALHDQHGGTIAGLLGVLAASSGLEEARLRQLTVLASGLLPPTRRVSNFLQDAAADPLVSQLAAKEKLLRPRSAH